MQRDELKKVLQKLSFGKIIIIILAGICLAVIAVPNSSFLEIGEENVAQVVSYRTELETSLISFLSGVEGVGKADAVIYTRNNEKIYFTEQEKEAEIIGILISCEGAASYELQSQIIESVSALFGISTNKIRVLKSEL